MKKRESRSGATGPRTQKGKVRSSQNARKHGLTASKILPSEAELVDALFDGYCKEFQLEDAAELGIGRKLAYNELRLRQEREPPVCDLRSGESVSGPQTTAVYDGGVVPQGAAEPSSGEGKSKRNPCRGAKPPATQLFLSFAWMRALLVQSFPRLKLNQQSYQILHEKVLRRDGWRCQSCGSPRRLQVHHMQSRSRLGDDAEDNLITLCDLCHRRTHLH
jgi:hypothetical protein